MRSRISGISLILLLVILTSAINTELAEATSTIYIRADGSIEPDTASISTFDHITYTFTDDIIDSIVVERNNIVVDGAGYTLHGTGSGTGIDLSGVSNVTIKNTEIRLFTQGIGLVYSIDTSISGNTITANNLHGIYLYDCFNTSISGNTISDNYYGIELDDSSDTSISGNNIANNYYGIQLWFASDTSIFANTITANNWHGIYLYDCFNTSIFVNTITANNWHGIYLYDCFSTSISGNTIANNEWGIRLTGSPLSDSFNCIITDNTVAENDGGIYLESCEGITIYHNNLVDNSFQASCVDSANPWDNDCEGNYWSDYNGADSDGDGIGDTPYVIDEYNADMFPLMNLYWNPCDINHDLIVNMIDVGTSAKAFGTEPGDVRWNCHADITGPIYLEPDGRVNMRDIGLIAIHFGETYP